jgi:hypothetical protein
VVAAVANPAAPTRQIWDLFSLELWARIFLGGQRWWVDSPREAWRDTQTQDSASHRGMKVTPANIIPVQDKRLLR